MLLYFANNSTLEHFRTKWTKNEFLLVVLVKYIILKKIKNSAQRPLKNKIWNMALLLIQMQWPITQAYRAVYQSSRFNESKINMTSGANLIVSISVCWNLLSGVLLKLVVFSFYFKCEPNWSLLWSCCPMMSRSDRSFLAYDTCVSHTFIRAYSSILR